MCKFIFSFSIFFAFYPQAIGEKSVELTPQTERAARGSSQTADKPPFFFKRGFVFYIEQEVRHLAGLEAYSL